MEEAKSPEELKDIDDRVRERIFQFQSIYPFLSEDLLVDFVNLSQSFEENFTLVQELADHYDQDYYKEAPEDEAEESSG